MKRVLIHGIGYSALLAMGIGEHTHSLGNGVAVFIIVSSIVAAMVAIGGRRVA